MANTPTPHIAAREGDFAKTVLMPGDPLRAKFIAEQYLEDAVCVTDVRNMLGYTGFYRGKRISVMGGGMGIPSVGIYTYELFHFYGVERILRIGSAGALDERLGLHDLVLAAGACTDSNYAAQFRLPGTFAPVASFPLLECAVAAARRAGIEPAVGNVLSADAFYDDRGDSLLRWKSMGVLAVEMEAAGLYLNAARAGKQALCMLTVSDCPLRGDSLPAGERETGFRKMMEIALETALPWEES